MYKSKKRKNDVVATLRTVEVRDDGNKRCRGADDDDDTPTTVGYTV